MTNQSALDRQAIVQANAQTLQQWAVETILLPEPHRDHAVVVLGGGKYLIQETHGARVEHVPFAPCSNLDHAHRLIEAMGNVHNFRVQVNYPYSLKYGGSIEIRYMEPWDNPLMAYERMDEVRHLPFYITRTCLIAITEKERRYPDANKGK